MNSGLTDNGLAIIALRLFLSNERSQFGEGESILNTIAESISQSDDYSFENGIIGFGWLVAYLHYQEYIDIDSDEILEDVDDQVYKYTLQIISNSKDETDTLLEIVNYSLIRHLNKNPQELHYRKFIHYECINLIFDIFTHYLEISLNKKNIDPTELHNCCKILLKISYCLEYIKKTEWKKTLLQQLVKIIHHLELNFNKNNYPYEDLLILLLTAKQRKYKLAENKILDLILSCTTFSNHFILDTFKKPIVHHADLQDHELLFLLTNYNIDSFSV
ncbi:hypothetical protein EG352_16135 [Chryseobacterium indologenes]|uniref:Lanthionine synthetase C-like protein n=1 Tax=Chryseobacterium indologenes TaxID=253 RepID=A0AAD0Z1M5_CHRID|nr:hypothetical protein [Chryseobacterium indologenes]AZB19194.1 hypothetical protein EG352_16135 [Chryseobacterium indologenes]